MQRLQFLESVEPVAHTMIRGFFKLLGAVQANSLFILLALCFVLKVRLFIIPISGDFGAQDIIVLPETLRYVPAEQAIQAAELVAPEIYE